MVSGNGYLLSTEGLTSKGHGKQNDRLGSLKPLFSQETLNIQLETE